MAKVARLPANDRVPGTRAKPRKRRQTGMRYFAFLSYSHRDEVLADWLHQELEDFHVPSALAGKLTANGVIPKRLAPIFRDEHELAAADDLGEEIEAALAASSFLIVLCTPSAATSHWTNAEIECFKRTRPEGCVLAVIGGGEPFASEMPGREDEECFPPALRERYDKRGRPTGQRAEPLAADLRGGSDERRMGFLKLVAGMLGVGLDDIVQRENTRRQRRLAWITGASLTGMLVATGLALTAIQARDSARDQRREAEGLVAFMLGDLKDKLEPIGRLDALDGVGTKVLDYYRKQDASDLPDQALLQRSRALSLTAQVAYLRGNFDSALNLYREAMAGTAEAIRREPSDPDRLFEHAQNVFYYAEIAGNRGHLDEAERMFREYQAIARKMSSLQPDNLKFRMEVQYAATNLGAVLLKQRRFDEAVAQFTVALRTMQAIAAVDSSNDQYRLSVAESLAWLADAQFGRGDLATATDLRIRQIELLRSLASAKTDAIYRQRLIPAERALGNLYWITGETEKARQHYRLAIASADEVMKVEPDNTRWREFSFQSRLDFGRRLLLAGQSAEAEPLADEACASVQRLLSKDRRVPNWRSGLRDCLLLRSGIAMAKGQTNEALRHGRSAVEAATTVNGEDRFADAVGLARAYRILGDTERAAGNAEAARGLWQRALATMPSGHAERPSELKERAVILERLNKEEALRPIAARLAAIGYRAEG